MKRPYGTGQIYEKWGAYYGRWRTHDGRRLNRRLGPKRLPGSATGLTRPQAEHAFRRLQEAESARKRPAKVSGQVTVDSAVAAVRERLALEGARKSYLQNCESMQRVHISPALGARRIETVQSADVERLATTMLRRGLAPKTVRNVVTFLHSAFALAVESGWCTTNPVTRAARPRPRRRGDANADLRFLTIRQLEAVLEAIPDEVKRPTPAPSRRGRAGPAPPVPGDALGPVLRVIILTAALTGLRQSEFLGLRWKDVDRVSQRIRVRNAFVRGEHSAEGKSKNSMRRSVPMSGRLQGELARWQGRTVFDGDDDLVFAHPELGRPLDRTKVTRRLKRACRDAEVPVIRFHDLRHTFATQLAASGSPLRALQRVPRTCGS